MVTRNNPCKERGLADAVDSGDLAHIGPVATSHINFRGVLEFPVRAYRAQILMRPESHKEGA